MRRRRPVLPLAFGMLMAALLPAAAQPAPLAAAATEQSAPAPAKPGDPPGPSRPDDPFGEETTLAARPMIVMKGNATWDRAYDTLLDAFETLQQYLAKQGITPAGPATAIYTDADETGFTYEAGYPVAAPPASPPAGDISVSRSREGRALKFVHRGSYDTLDTTYEAITNHFDEKRLDSAEVFIEEFVTDPLKTSEDDLVINVYVPVKEAP